MIKVRTNPCCYLILFQIIIAGILEKIAKFFNTPAASLDTGRGQPVADH